MAKPEQRSSEWDFTVVREKLHLPNGNDAGLWAHVRQDNGVIVGHGTDDYGLVQNSGVIGKAKDSFDRAGLKNYEETINVFEGGKRMRAVFDFKDEVLDIPKRVGDQIGFRLELGNSFDRSLRVNFALGFLRLWCANGCASLVKEFGLTAKHSSKVNVDNLITDTALGKALDAFKNQRNVFSRMADKEITQEQGLTILQNLTRSKTLTEKVREEIALKWNNPAEYDTDRNLYNLYNAGTAYLTHGLQTERFEYANELNRKLLKTLDAATRNPTRLTELVKVPKNEELVIVE